MNNSNLIDLYVYDRFADWEVALVTAHLNGFPGQFLPSRFRVRTVGVTRDPVITMGGLRVTPDTTFEEALGDSPLLAILPGGLGWEEGHHKRALDYAGTVHQRGGLVAAICGATFGLASVGLLDNRAHTSNAPEYLTLTGYAGSALYRSDLGAVTDARITTAGSTHSLEFATELFKALELHPPAVLSAWQGLFATGEARYFSELMGARAQLISSEAGMG